MSYCKTKDNIGEYFIEFLQLKNNNRREIQIYLYFFSYIKLHILSLIVRISFCTFLITFRILLISQYSPFYNNQYSPFGNTLYLSSNKICTHFLMTFRNLLLISFCTLLILIFHTPLFIIFCTSSKIFYTSFLIAFYTLLIRFPTLTLTISSILLITFRKSSVITSVLFLF